MYIICIHLAHVRGNQCVVKLEYLLGKIAKSTQNLAFSDRCVNIDHLQ